jgi:hypothetical protein
MALGRLRRPFLGSLDPNRSPDSLLRHGLAQAREVKRSLRAELERVEPDTRMENPLPKLRLGKLRERPELQAGLGAAEGREEDSRVEDRKSETTYDANLGVTTMVAGVRVRRTRDELALILDPRSWSCSGVVIGAAFLVEEDESGQYEPSTKLDEIALGNPWKAPPNHFLYEYARSEIASFENVLEIDEFLVSDVLVRANYRLYDCLVCTFGIFSAPGGLRVNEGHVKATAEDDGWWSIEVVKRVQVRDLTPHDPGNRYDFGQWVNQTIGAALSQWVRDTSIMSPVL